VDGFPQHQALIGRPAVNSCAGNLIRDILDLDGLRTVRRGCGVDAGRRLRLQGFRRSFAPALLPARQRRPG
jgi:hypothetical protein